MPVLTFPNLLTGQPAVTVFVGAPAGWNESREEHGLPAVYPVPEGHIAFIEELPGTNTRWRRWTRPARTSEKPSR